MVNEKEMKADFRSKAQQNPEKYYPVKILIEEGFTRKKCGKCGNYFWSASPEREVCGEPDCSGGYTFIGDTPAREKMDFIQTWTKFSDFFSKLGYVPINRYPVAARWRDDTDFVQASIYDFQPYVVKGDIEPPANPLVVPQFSLRFNDIDNVGITGRHYTGFVMIGQHAFEPKDNYKPEDYLRHIYLWLTQGMKIPREEIQFHEDAWAGGGNLGPSIEFFSRGLEIGNQVYMQYDIRQGSLKELEIKVLDMGMGQERPAWFTHATGTSYDVVFGSAMEKLYRATSLRPEQNILKEFIPYSGLLNIDENIDIEKVWKSIAEKLELDVSALRARVLPLAALYSISDHSRSLLVALSDGVLPSNSGGGYNLRVLLRRSLDFINKYSWDIDLSQICEWHASYLKPQYPELMEHLGEVDEILAVEERKYRDTRKKAKRIIKKLKDREVTPEGLINLYDSQGISPEMLLSHGLKIELPQDFFIRLAERHEKNRARKKEKKFREFVFEGIPKTEILYYSDYLLLEFKAKVLKIIDNKYVILDKTAFYPTSGGQASDRGYLNNSRVTDVFKQGGMVIHRLEDIDFGEGNTVAGKIDASRRIQLTQHHTATHIINGAARQILGEHIWQAGAEKTIEKARLDITHYESLTQEEVDAIEDRANEIIAHAIPVENYILKRNIAEAQYGFRLYQGGAVPGMEIRVVKIDDIDVEACGGTHLKNTSKARLIRIISSTKIQDGVVRLEFAAGKAAFRYIKERDRLLSESSEVLSVNPEQLPESVRRFFREWKEQRKEIQRLKQEIAELRKADLKHQFRKINNAEYIVAEIEADIEESIKTARGLAADRKAVLLLGIDDKISVVGARGEKLELNMAEIVAEVARLLGGGGGGKPEFAQGAGKRKDKIKEALKLAESMLREKLKN